MKKIAIVTGASSGMGMEFARQISKKIPCIKEIWLIARRKERMEEFADTIDVPCKIIEADLMNDEFFYKFDNLLKSSDIKVKMLVNAAGFGKVGRFEDISFYDNGGMVRLNCECLTRLTHIVLPYMQKKSRIINFASSAAFMPQPAFAVYAATKSYVLSLSRALHYELKDREIYVTAVCPGPVATEFFDIAEEGQKKAWFKKFFMADCEKVVTKALTDSIDKKQKSVYGFSMNAFYILTKLVPTKTLLGIVSFISLKKD